MTADHYSTRDFIKYLITDKDDPDGKLFDRHVSLCSRCRNRLARVVDSM